MKTLKNARIHLIGVGGVSMSALAEYCLLSGAIVSGSDRADGKFLRQLADKGASVYVGENADCVDDVDIVVYSSAVRENNLELVRANELHKEVFERHEFLGIIAKNFDLCVAIAGTHGKTTVTAMIIHILKEQNANFVGHVGGETEYGNLVINRAEGKRFFVTEACEYKRSLLSLTPTIGVVLNCECDHPDCYPDLQSVQNVFDEFLDKSQIKISLICKNEHMSNSAYGNSEGEESYAENKAEIEVISNGRREIWSYLDIREDNAEICVTRNGKMECICPTACGEHNKLNAVFALAVVNQLGCPTSRAVNALASFKGVERRYERVGKINGAELIFDYAHHPTQIRATLAVAKEKGRVLVVFQPHTYSRTARFMYDFVAELCKADGLVIMATYAAREKTESGCDSQELYENILSNFAERDVYMAETHTQTVEIVKKLSSDYDVVLFLGAGDVYSLKGAFEAR